MSSNVWESFPVRINSLILASEVQRIPRLYVEHLGKVAVSVTVQYRMNPEKTILNERSKVFLVVYTGRLGDGVSATRIDRSVRS